MDFEKGWYVSIIKWLMPSLDLHKEINILEYINGSLSVALRLLLVCSTKVSKSQTLDKRNIITQKDCHEIKLFNSFNAPMLGNKYGAIISKIS